MDLILATRNAAKGREMLRLLGPVPAGVAVRTLDAYPECPEAVEDGETFAQNALIKAKVACSHTGQWALADDSGLEVPCLDGEPGVQSARYCGHHGDDAANNRLLLAKLAGVGEAGRAARFVTVVALVGPDGTECAIPGKCDGLIAGEPRGEGGFGYDCLFLRPELDKTFAELTGEQKDAISHRGHAFARTREVIWALMAVDR